MNKERANSEIEFALSFVCYSSYMNVIFPF